MELQHNRFCGIVWRTTRRCPRSLSFREDVLLRAAALIEDGDAGGATIRNSARITNLRKRRKD